MNPLIDLHAELPEGFVYCASVVIPNSNEVLVFSYNKKSKISEIGKINLLSKSYTKYLNDEKWEDKYSFGKNVLQPKLFVKGDCTELNVLFVSCSTYYVLNISHDLCNVTYEDTLYFHVIVDPWLHYLK